MRQMEEQRIWSVCGGAPAKITIIVALCFFINVVIAAGVLAEEPRFVEPIQNVTIPAGRDVKLACVVDNLASYKVAWIAYDKSAILTVKDDVITRNQRVNITYDGHRTWTLHISRVNSSDAGTYMCQVNTIKAKSQFGVLNVVVPPDIIDSESSSDVVIQEGGNITLKCAATGTPPPLITWRRENTSHTHSHNTTSHRVFEREGEQLELTSVSRTDMAAYLCIARNGVLPSVSKRIRVNVEFAPSLSIPHQLVGAPVGNYSVDLQCTVEAYPPPLMYWTRDIKDINTMIYKSDKYIITKTGGSVKYRSHIHLNITTLTKDDFGTYKCMAKNSRGETEGKINLYETEPPTQPPTPPTRKMDHVEKGSRQKATIIRVGSERETTRSDSTKVRGAGRGRNDERNDLRLDDKPGWESGGGVMTMEGRGKHTQEKQKKEEGGKAVSYSSSAESDK